MLVNTHKNEYQHAVVDCPFCDRWFYERLATKASPDPLRDLKKHITNEAKNEAFAWALNNEAESVLDTPHLDYYKEHTSPAIIIPKTAKRVYDQDLIQ